MSFKVDKKKNSLPGKKKKTKKIPSRLAQHWDVLSVLSKASSPMGKHLVQKAPKEIIDTVCECCLNVLKGTVPLSPEQKQKLGKHRYLLRQMVKKKIPLHQKKKMMVQRGGFLPLPIRPLLKAVAAPILGSIVENLESVVGNLMKPPHSYKRALHLEQSPHEQRLWKEENSL